MKPNDASIVQLMAWAIYGASPDDAEALGQARQMLQTLNPKASLDPETLKLWGDLHLHRWYLNEQPEDLAETIFAHEKSFYLRNDYADGITLAFLLNVRARRSEPAEAIADFVMAQRIRRTAAALCREALASLRQAERDDPPETTEQERSIKEKKYQILAALWEAAVGLGDEASVAQWKQQAFEAAPSIETREATQKHLAQLNELLADSPMQYDVVP